MLRLLLITAILVTIACGTAAKAEPDTDEQVVRCITVLAWVQARHTHSVGDTFFYPSAERISGTWAKLLDQECQPLYDQELLEAMKERYR